MKYVEKLTKKKYSPIGLEIDDDCIRIMQLKRSNGHWNLHRMAQDDLRSSGQTPENYKKMLIKKIKDMVNNNSLHGRQVVSTLSNRDVDILPVRLTINDDNELETRIIENARARLSYNVENAVIDYLPINACKKTDDESKSFWIIASQRPLIDQHLMILKQAGLHSKAIDIKPCALVRSVMLSGYGVDGKILLIHLGERDSVFLLIENKDLVAERICLKGYQDMVDKIQHNLKIDKKNAVRLLLDYGFIDKSIVEVKAYTTNHDGIGSIVQEIILPVFHEILEGLRDFLNYCYAEIRDVAIETVYLSGRTCFVRNLDRMLQESTEIKTEVLNPLKPIQMDKRIFSNININHNSVFSVSLGLTLRA